MSDHNQYGADAVIQWLKDSGWTKSGQLENISQSWN